MLVGESGLMFLDLFMSADVKTKLQRRQYEMIKTAHLFLWQLIMFSLFKCSLHIFAFKLK